MHMVKRIHSTHHIMLYQNQMQIRFVGVMVMDKFFVVLPEKYLILPIHLIASVSPGAEEDVSDRQTV